MIPLLLPVRLMGVTEFIHALIPLAPLQLVPMQFDGSVLGLLLGSGGVAMIYALVSAYRTLKSGARSDDLDDYTQLERRANIERRGREYAERTSDYWHRYAGAMEYELTRTAGPEAVKRIQDSIGPPPEPPPEEPPLPARRVKVPDTPDTPQEAK